MGHSSINVSLTYLRGLEIAKLKEEDMPIWFNCSFHNCHINIKVGLMKSQL
jgi:hypothetical protein